MVPDEKELLAIYRRLISDEPDAPVDLVELCLDPLIRVLQLRYPTLPDPDWASDIATDTLLSFAQDPYRYIPERGHLWSYLILDASRNLQNLIQKEERRRRRLISLNSVDLVSLDRNINVEEEVLERLVPTFFAGQYDVNQIYEQLRREITDPRDWQVLRLLSTGERRTQVFAEVLGIAHLPADEQRKQVKRVKDRLRIRLKRLGERQK
jgi:glycerol-3-phosphate cytidylyltransferase-like family protein